MRVIGLAVLVLTLAGCGETVAASTEEGAAVVSTDSTLTLTDDQKGELSACLRGYVNRHAGPGMIYQASTACYKASLDLPTESTTAKYAKAMHEAAEAMFAPDAIEEKRLEAKAEALSGPAYSETGTQW